MEFRRAGAASHLGQGLVTGVDGAAGLEFLGNAIQPASDTTATDLYVGPKSGGKLFLGSTGSTVSLQIVQGLSTTVVPNMPPNSQAISTMTCVGISTGDIVLSVSPRDGLSTSVTLSRSYAGTDEIINVWINPHASSIAAEAAQTCRWAYIDRT